MRAVDVAIIDYGLGNLLSVRRALEHCGATVEITAEPEVILNASRVVLPGVGAFANGMKALHQHGLDKVVRQVAIKNTPLLAICLGMQMLLDESEEFGLTPGLGLIPGSVIPIPAIRVDGTPQKIPHIGWSALVPPSRGDKWCSKYLELLKPGEEVYFVHSFMAAPLHSEHLIAESIYGGVSIPAVIGYKNIIGCQFHPEKSGDVGLKILRKFIDISAT